MDYSLARRHMVDSQILPNRVTDERLISVIAELPREKLLSDNRRPLAYADDSVPIEEGRHLMMPMVFSRLIDAAEVKKTDVVLSIGCATGYAVAVLAKLAETVVAVEPDSGLRQKAERNLADLGIDNVAIVAGALTKGHPKEAPYHLIYIDGAVPEMPVGITQQLADGGRLVAVVAASGAVTGRGVIVRRLGNNLATHEIFDARIPLLPGFEKEPTFRF